MSLLESFFNNHVENSRFFPRKVSLPDTGSYHLYGARGVGKTTLVIESLQSLPEDSWLYIDCQDPVFALEDIDDVLLDAFVDLSI
jgi:predicted AAA+ superfamily ATPase